MECGYVELYVRESRIPRFGSNHSIKPSSTGVLSPPIEVLRLSNSWFDNHVVAMGGYLSLC